MVSYYDISEIHSYRGKGLSTVAMELLGKKLDKSNQRSDWQRRPLSDSQIVYAATDAAVLLPIVHKIVTLSPNIPH